MATPSIDVTRVAENPRYQALVHRRDRFARILAAVMLTAYFGFVLLVAFDKPLLARSVAGGATSVGIPVGLGLILLAIALTALYVRRANRDFDTEIADVRREIGA